MPVLDINNRIVITGIAIGLSAAASGFYYYYLNKKVKSLLPPKNWKLAGTIDEIVFFPIKGCSGISIKNADCDVLGVKNGKYRDRQFMIINEKHKLMVATHYPQMLKIKTTIVDGYLIVSAPGMNQLKIDFESFSKNGRSDVPSELWEIKVHVTECGSEYDAWFSQFLLGNDRGLKLVYYQFPVPNLEISDTASTCSYMIMNNDSVKELNEKLEEKVTHLHFRGNFIVKTINDKGFAEDKWNWIKIGTYAVFHKVSPCYRCIFPNINPETGERSRNYEPLRTLKTFRVFGAVKQPQMGIQCGIITTGSVKVGDEVYVDDI